MELTIEPRDGRELERMITALLNATGVIHRMIEATGCPPGLDGADIIGLVAERARLALAPLAEHRSDADLAEVTAIVAQVTLILAAEMDLASVFFPDAGL